MQQHQSTITRTGVGHISTQWQRTVAAVQSHLSSHSQLYLQCLQGVLTSLSHLWLKFWPMLQTGSRIATKRCSLLPHLCLGVSPKLHSTVVCSRLVLSGSGTRQKAFSVPKCHTFLFSQHKRIRDGRSSSHWGAAQAGSLAACSCMVQKNSSREDPKPISQALSTNRRCFQVLALHLKIIHSSSSYLQPTWKGNNSMNSNNKKLVICLQLHEGCSTDLSQTLCFL